MVGYARMPLKSGTEFAKGGKFTDREIAASGKYAVIDRSQVAGRKDECVLAYSLTSPGLRVVMHLVKIQGGHYVCNAQGSPRMSGFGYAHHPDNVSSDLGGYLLKILYV